MFGLSKDDLEVGDKITQDGLMECTVVGFDGSLGMKDGLVELEHESHDGTTETSVKTEREISCYFSKLK
jgi:hypothetical protein